MISYIFAAFWFVLGCVFLVSTLFLGIMKFCTFLNSKLYSLPIIARYIVVAFSAFLVSISPFSSVLIAFGTLDLIALIKLFFSYVKHYFTKINDNNRTTVRLTEEPSPLASPLASPPYPAANRTSQSMAELTAIGLASIGRKTHSLNSYLTVEITEERRRVERPFLRVIADKYRDEGQRKLLARHFMLYKETTLFIVYASVLRADKQLHRQVQTELKKQLSLGLSAEVQKKRNDYWNRILRKFYDRYQQTSQTKDALNFSFWSVLSEEKPEYFPMESAAEFLGNNFLYDIFRYSYEGVEREYREKVQQ